MVNPKYLTEFIGAFFLVFAVCSAAPMGGVAAALAIGGTLAVMVYAGGAISGAHYNPAVSVALYLRGVLDRRDLVRYIAAQLIGAVLGAGLAGVVAGEFFAPEPLAQATPLQVLFAEAIITFGLALVIMNVATSRSSEGNSYFGLAIGGTIAIGILTVGGISGAVFNPAVGLGPILVKSLTGEGGFGNLWYDLVGPLVGAVLAGPVFRIQD